MGHKCFISFKTENEDYKNQIQNNLDVDMIDRSLNEPIASTDEDYIMQKIRQDHLLDSTVTITLLGSYSAENSMMENQNFIKREMQASLYNSPNGILGVVLPEMYESVYRGQFTCSICGQKHNYVNIDNSTTIREFNYNYYLPLAAGKHIWSEEDRYCVLVRWDDFKVDQNAYINQAFDKRTSPARDKIKVFPK